MQENQILGWLPLKLISLLYNCYIKYVAVVQNTLHYKKS